MEFLNLPSFLLLYCFLIKIVSTETMDKKVSLMGNDELENDLADLLAAKSYLPQEKQLPTSSIIKSEDDDATYLLSKLSDEELVKLLNDQPTKQEYELKDIAQVAAGLIVNKKDSNSKLKDEMLNMNKKGDVVNYETNNKQMPFFRLENKKVEPESINNAHYVAMQKLNSLINSRPQFEDDSLDDEKKELLFNVLVSQLKTLCCKRPKKQDSNSDPLKMKPTEYMFLILNEEIKSNGSNELVLVDPDTLQQNSSVLLLGPIVTPLTDRQLKIIMDRIARELSKPDYEALLQQLSEGTLSDSNVRLMKNFIHGTETRRYIKPHRCNYQSKLARVYGGPRWLICTGYINLNTPSLYD